MTDSPHTTSTHPGPRVAYVLGLAGLIPFVAALLGVWVLDGQWFDLSAQALSVYGAVILSFLGGIRWGMALLGKGGDDDLAWVLSIVPSLVAWAAVLIGGPSGLILLACGFGAQWLYDMRAVQDAALPTWFGGLRTVLTLGAVLSQLLGAVALLR